MKSTNQTASTVATEASRPAPDRGPADAVGTFELSIILPTYNEADNIPELLRRIARVVTERSIRCEVLVMDDRSPDATAQAARDVEAPIPVRVVERTGERGLSPAVIEGVALARGQYVLVMDGDLQHPPESLVDLLRAVRDGADIAIGSRYAAGGTCGELDLYRKVNSRVATLLAAPLVGQKVRDPMAGFFCFRRGLVGRCELNPVGYKIGLEILVKCRPARVVEVPINFGSRRAGDSKMDLWQQVDYLRHLRGLYGWRWPEISQWVLFCAVGSCGLVVDLTVMTMLVGLGVTFPLARVAAIGTAMVSNFFLNRWITFPEAAGGRCRSQLARFIGVCSLGLGVNWTVSNALYVLLPSLRWMYQLYCVGGVLAATANNFLLSKYVAFKVPSKHTDR